MMTSTTLTSKNLEEQLLEVVPYNVYDQNFPKRLDDHLRNCLAVLQKVIHKGKLTSVSTLIVTEITRDDKKVPISITVYAFGSFRRQFSAVTQLAKALTPFYLEIGILPIIKPIFSKIWEAESQQHGEIYTKIHQRGIMVFSKTMEFPHGT